MAVQDLSHLAANGPWATSQAGGNMVSSNEQAMTGPGSPPVDPLPDRDHQGDPHVSFTEDVALGTPPPRAAKPFAASPVAWKAD